MTEKQKRFCDEYLSDLNATRAYKAVYKSVKSDEVAKAAASRLLTNVNVKKYIADQQEVIPYASYTLFPTIGKTNAIYVDTTTNAIYRWDDNNIKYYALAFDPEKEFIMQCGSSKG